MHRAQLLAAGIASTSIDRLLARGQVIAVFRGVYLVGVPGLTHREFLRACVLHAGPLAWPYGRSGLELRGVVKDKPGWATLLTTKDMATQTRTMVPLNDGGLAS